MIPYRTAVATNASIEAPLVLNRMPGLSKPALEDTPRTVPDWYPTVNSTHNRFRSDSLTLRNLRTLSDKALSKDLTGLDLQQAYNKTRDFLHQIALFDFAGKEKEIIKKSMLLVDGTFDDLANNSFPHDLRDIATILQRRWWKGDTDPNLMRGINKTTSKTKDGNIHTTHALDPKYPFRVPSNYIGHGNLTIGQWWPLQICAVRDGAHGEIEAGIYGLKTSGAVSIILSGGGYVNIDEGDKIQYCGTANVKDVPSANTKLMLLAYQTRQLIRVLRSTKAGSKFCPKKGIRYEGLFKIVGFEVIDVEVALHRFSLVRRRDQPPVCYEGVAARPNWAEVAAVERDRELRGVGC